MGTKMTRGELVMNNFVSTCLSDRVPIHLVDIIVSVSVGMLLRILTFKSVD